MLTRMRLQGFKNFEDTEVRFGPFTCIAGANGVGKSNLFDAIQFLRDLTEFPIIEAASRVRDPSGKTGDIRAIFTQALGQPPDVQIEADFIVPDLVYDEFNRDASPSATFLRYVLKFRYVPASSKTSERIELLEESLVYIQKTREAKKTLGFPTSTAFINSTIKNRRRGKEFISTVTNAGNTTIRLHQEGGVGGGRPFLVPAANSNKTIVGGITTNDYPTVLAARREMQSWTLLQLEPSALRQPDAFSVDPHLTANGAHMAATLLRLGAEAAVSNRLADLLDDLDSVFVERDDSRRTYTLHAKSRDGTEHSARSLSDGTLRFLALAILATDPESGRVLCLEEPENGIHPSRIPAILKLLRHMTADTQSEVDSHMRLGPDNSENPRYQTELPVQIEDSSLTSDFWQNPLRQVIINTHSPKVVSSLDINDLLMARLARRQGVSRTIFEFVEKTWRAQAQPDLPTITKGELLNYLENDSNRAERQDSSISVRDYIFHQADMFPTDTAA